MDFFQKINKNMKGKQYCPIFSKIVKKFDLFNLLSDAKIENLCQELSFVNKSLNKAYIIIFKKNLSMEEAIKKISNIKDNNKKKFINEKDAKEIYG